MIFVPLGKTPPVNKFYAMCLNAMCKTFYVFYLLSLDKTGKYRLNQNTFFYIPSS